MTNIETAIGFLKEQVRKMQIGYKAADSAYQVHM